MSAREDVKFTAGEISFILHRLRILKNAIVEDLQVASSNHPELSKLRGISNSIDIVGNILSHGKDYRLSKDRMKYFHETPQQFAIISEGPNGVKGFYISDADNQNQLVQSLIENGDLITKLWVVEDDPQHFTVYERLSDLGDEI